MKHHISKIIIILLISGASTIAMAGGSVTLPDGSVQTSVTLSNGIVQTTIKTPDGSTIQTTPQSDGTSVVVTSDPNGNVLSSSIISPSSSN